MDTRSADLAPTVSVVMPLFNAEATIDACLAPLVAMRAAGEVGEIIVVDDGCTDSSVERVQRHPGVRLLRRGPRAGPAAARNAGSAEASGEYLWFVDSDVVLAPDAARVLQRVLVEVRPQAVMGSYDDAPGAPNFLSQYKNLVHAYYHHRGRREAATFWSGCGAIQRSVFDALGGFDAARYPYPSIEDIELGYRVREAGGRIVLEPSLQGKHLKEWRLANLLHTEIFRRAIPWSELMFERKALTDDLNVGRGERLRALLALGSVGAFAAWALGWVPAALPAVVAGATIVANWPLLAFFHRRRGAIFALRAFLFHQAYYCYSSASFAAAWVRHRLGGRVSSSSARQAPPA